MSKGDLMSGGSHLVVALEAPWVRRASWLCCLVAIVAGFIMCALPCSTVLALTLQDAKSSCGITGGNDNPGTTEIAGCMKGNGFLWNGYCWTGEGGGCREESDGTTSPEPSFISSLISSQGLGSTVLIGIVVLLALTAGPTLVVLIFIELRDWSKWLSGRESNIAAHARTRKVEMENNHVTELLPPKFGLFFVLVACAALCPFVGRHFAQSIPRARTLLDAVYTGNTRASTETLFGLIALILLALSIVELSAQLRQWRYYKLASQSRE